MNLELKKIAVYPRMSEETTAYKAELHCNGKKVADLGNSGQGGPDDQHWTTEGRTMLEAIEAYLKAMSPVAPLWEGGPPMQMDLELWASQQLAKWEHDKWFKKASKTKTMFRLSDDNQDAYRTLGTTNVDQAVAFLSKKYGQGKFVILTK